MPYLTGSNRHGVLEGVGNPAGAQIAIRYAARGGRSVIKELTRTMNAAERAWLTECVTDIQPFITFRDTLNWFIVWSGGLICCGLLAAGIFLAELSPLVGGMLLGPLAIVAIICLYVVIQMWSSYFHWSAVHRNFVRRDVPDIEHALFDGMVAVKNIDATAVIELVEFEDEGGGFIFDLGDGQVLFLKGQQYFPVIDEMPWPNSQFEIVRTVHGNRWVGIFCHGSRLNPVRTIETSDCIEEIACAEREEVVEADIETFALSLMAA